jgi:hypothetical protein
MQDWAEMKKDTSARGLLAKLGLPPNAIVNVITAEEGPSTSKPDKLASPDSQAVAADMGLMSSASQAPQATSTTSASDLHRGSRNAKSTGASSVNGGNGMPFAAEAGVTGSNREAGGPRLQGQGPGHQRLLLTTIGQVHVLSRC